MSKLLVTLPLAAGWSKPSTAAQVSISTKNCWAFLKILFGIILVFLTAKSGQSR